jgi:two-component system sensor histidine kinase QseC
MNYSMRTRLLTVLLAATTLIWLSASWWNYFDARHEAEEMLDAQLAQSAHLLLAQTRHELVEEGEPRITEMQAVDQGELHPYEQQLTFRIRGKHGQTLLASHNPPPEPATTALGYSDLHVGEQGWRMFVTEDTAHSLRVEVVQSLDIRERLACHVAANLALPIVFVLPLLAGLIYLLVGRALRPLDQIAGKVASRTASNLSPLEYDGLPREIRTLSVALNKLLARLGKSLESERRFTADAAHELRTPLAAIHIQAQVALASPEGEARSHALQQVLVGTRRGTHLVEQLLRLARLDPLAELREVRLIQLAPLLRQAADEVDPERQRIDLVTADDVGLDGDPELLRMALRNLLENALRYSPESGRIVLGAEAGRGYIRLWVADSGPGVAEAELPRLAERFYRGREASQPGSGLGLAIVARIARLHGGYLMLENREEGGLLATLDFPIGSR